MHNLLLSGRKAPQLEVLDEAPFIDGFNETGAFVAVDFNGSADDGLCETGGFLKQGMHSIRLCFLCGLL